MILALYQFCVKLDEEEEEEEEEDTLVLLIFLWSLLEETLLPKEHAISPFDKKNPEMWPYP